LLFVVIVNMSNAEKGVVSEKGSDHEQAKNFDHAVGDAGDAADLTALGYKPELKRNRSMFTLLFQSLAIAAVSLPQSRPLHTGANW
jgi:hypothetical protein